MNTSSWEETWKRDTQAHKRSHGSEKWETKITCHRPWAYEIYEKNTRITDSDRNSWSEEPHKGWLK